MKESEWLSSVSPDEMLNHLAGTTTKRKARLLACACCRRLWPALSERARGLVELAERFADRRVRRGEMPTGGKGFHGLDFPERAAYLVANKHASLGTFRLAVSAARYASGLTAGGRHTREALEQAGATQADLTRDIFRPYRPFQVDAAWRTPTVLALATAADEERILPEGHLDRQRLAILADALEDENCGDFALLEHLRGPGPCVRGCEAIDAILQRK